jgi:hypothetical protein
VRHEPTRQRSRSAHRRHLPGIALRIGLAGCGTLFGVGVIVGSGSVASAIAPPTPTTLYVDNVNGMATTGCTSAGSGACQTIQEGVNAAEALSNATVTLDVAGSSTTYDEQVTVNIPESTFDSIDIEGTGTTAPTLNDGGHGSDLTIPDTSDNALTIGRFTISGGDADNGGGIDDLGSGDLNITDSTLSDNTAVSLGGALDAVGSGGTITFTNSTLSGNRAFDGGGINFDPALVLTDDTFAGNSAQNFGGGYEREQAPNATIANSLFADNTPGNNCAGGSDPIDNGHNVSDDSSCGFGSSSSNEATGIGTLTLAANGSDGPETEAIGPGSAAYGEVPLSACASITTDERGDARPGAGESACDAGAFEYRTPAATSPTPPPTPPSPLCAGTTGNAGFICTLYLDLLNRLPDSAGLATFGGQLSAGVSRTTVASEILSSTEYRSDLISSYYVAYIQRAPDPGGLATFLAGLASGAGDEAVQAGILGSTEFAIDRSGAASGAYETSVFLFELYALLLNRGIDPNGDGTFGSQLAAGVSATQVATEILNSKEYRIDLITGYYEKYLGRGTDPGGLATYLAAFSAGATNESVEAGILGSPEFFAKSG